MPYRSSPRLLLHSSLASLTSLTVASLLLAGCGDVVVQSSTTTGEAGTSSSSASAGGTGGAGGQTVPPGGGGAGGCGAPHEGDLDGDGYSVAGGDCDDCNPDVNPGAAEVNNVDPGDPSTVPLDDNCDGQIDEDPPICDYELAFDSNDPLDAAAAMELCQVVSKGDPYGILSAAWKQPDSSDPPADKLDLFHIGHGILQDFGPHVPPKVGGKLLALSNGAARTPEDPGYGSSLDKGYGCAHPDGMPFESPMCPDNTATGAPFDGIALQLEIQPPKNAVAFTYHFQFYTHDWPNYICTKFNDQLAVLLSPPPPYSPVTGNIALDQNANPLTTSFLLPETCSCGPQGCPPGSQCEMNPSMLEGTGFFGNGAASHFLTSSALIEKGTDKITLRFTIYDAGDGNGDSTALIDGFRWLGVIPTSGGGAP